MLYLLAYIARSQHNCVFVSNLCNSALARLMNETENKSQ